MIIRTKLVELSTLPAVAYRQKLNDGPGLVVLRYDSPQPGLAGISRSTGQPVPAANTDTQLHPLEAFQEAMELTAGLPYARRGRVKLGDDTQPGEGEAAPESPVEDFAVVDSADYQAIVSAFTNRRGELSYELLNRDFIQFARSSTVVADMVAAYAGEEELRDHILRARFETLTGNPHLSQAQRQRIVELLDEVSPRSVFRELNEELRRMLSAGSSAPG